MRILAIDPGSERSAAVWYNTETEVPDDHQIMDNESICLELRQIQNWRLSFHHMVVEHSKAYTVVISGDRRVFFQQLADTIFWVGRFVQAFHHGRRNKHTLIERREVKQVLCGTDRVGDPQVKEALIDRYGGKEKAIGRKANPGPLYGIKRDEWAALAVAVAWAEMR